MQLSELSPLALSIWNTLHDLTECTGLTVETMAAESMNDGHIAIDRRAAYKEVYEYCQD